MAEYTIALNNGPQRFRVQLVNTVYQFVIVWRDAVDGGWFLDINDASGNGIIMGIAMVSGIDMLVQYKHLNIGGALFLNTPGAQQSIPEYNDLGSPTNLLFVTES